MPIIPVKFKPDGENEKPISIKHRSYSPFDFKNQVSCHDCTNLIKPQCLLNVEECFYMDCPDCTDPDKIFFRCRNYAEPSCKEGYPYSVDYLSCEAYNGPKPSWGIWYLVGGKPCRIAGSKK